MPTIKAKLALRKNDALIIQSFSMANGVMDFKFSEDNDYDNFNCDSRPAVSLLCNTIRMASKGTTENFPIIAHDRNVNSKSVCMYSMLNSGKWYCADNTGYVGFVNINPGTKGYCINGESAVCPFPSF